MKEETKSRVICGHSLIELRKLPDESVDMFITSPPYYGLRNYGTDPVIWGGDKNCSHKWGETTPPSVNKAGNYKPSGIEQTNRANDAGAISQARDIEVGGQFCQLCGAWKGELGSEPTVQLFVEHLLEIFAEVYRVLKPTGTCWINIADTYGGTGYGKGTGNFNNKNNPTCMTQPKDKSARKKSQLCVPERLVLGMIDQGWIKRNTIIWHKPSCLPSSAKDRFTIDFENLYFFVKSEKYYFEQQFEPYSDSFLNDNRHGKDLSHYNEWKPYGEAGVQGGRKTRSKIFEAGINEKGRNKRSVWSINPAHSKMSHFACFPKELITTPILAGCPEGGVVLDCFAGTFTTAVVAHKLHRDYIMIELSPEYYETGCKRLKKLTDQERLWN